ncbi:DUF1015 domain-containing protein [Urechidicola croceus]|uniref:DUF1015 domain-containing protein n=1 Tax=Urechidicola croceus TaxID=1850246 RepID=A0A1D8P4Z9_9FLAO|nr:DUF1015 domain-containing protein [Urechidicola croceus]AOW19672.1 hypothetical protein LPB138_02795 [Urechidicola croceus]
MANIKPFRAVRANKDIVSLVSSRSFDFYTNEEVDEILATNPYSFLNIIKPTFRDIDGDLTAEQRFNEVKGNYLKFKEQKIFLREEISCFYIYKKIKNGITYCGIIAATSTDDYKNDVIKKHENTIKSRKNLFKNYLKSVGFNAEPVLLTYPDNDAISQIMNVYQKTEPEYSFNSSQNNSNFLWLITNKDDIDVIKKEFQKMKSIYIADGHHRSASSFLLSQELKSLNPNHTGLEDYNFFMSYLIPESSLKISSFNRFIKDLNGLSKDEFLDKLNKTFKIKNLGQRVYTPSKKHHFSMYLDGDYYSLYLKKSTYKIENPLSDLDAQLLFDTVLKPILGIKNLKNSNKIEYKPAINLDNKLKSEVDSGKFKVSFGLFPASVNQLKTIADANLKMPPKSTYIEPKLRSALTLYEF